MSGRDSGLGRILDRDISRETNVVERERESESISLSRSGAKVQTVRACQIDRFIYIAKVAREKFKDWMAPFCLRIRLEV